jgi:hypothetical protein
VEIAYNQKGAFAKYLSFQRSTWGLKLRYEKFDDYE